MLPSRAVGTLLASAALVSVACIARHEPEAFTICPNASTWALRDVNAATKQRLVHVCIVSPHGVHRGDTAIIITRIAYADDSVGAVSFGWAGRTRLRVLAESGRVVLDQLTSSVPASLGFYLMKGGDTLVDTLRWAVDSRLEPGVYRAYAVVRPQGDATELSIVAPVDVK